MTQDEAKAIFMAIAMANKHPDPEGYAQEALNALVLPETVKKGG